MTPDDLNEGEALREIVMLCGEPDPSDGEGISPQDCVDAVRARLKSTAPERADAIDRLVVQAALDVAVRALSKNTEMVGHSDKVVLLVQLQAVQEHARMTLSEIQAILKGERK